MASKIQYRTVRQMLGAKGPYSVESPEGKKWEPVGELHFVMLWGNTHVVFTNAMGEVVFRMRVGQLLRGSRRKSAYGRELLASRAVERCLASGYRKAVLKLSGFGFGRRGVMKGLMARRKEFLVLGVSYETRMPHNGCRRRKSRRL